MITGIHYGIPSGRSRQRLCAFAALAAAWLVSAADVVAQDLRGSQSPNAPAPVEAAPPPPASPGLPPPREVFGAIGRFIDQSISNVGAGVGAGVRGAGETLGATTNAAGEIAKGVGDAAGTVARLPTTNIVSGHELCASAPNGAPDCIGASIALCKTRGFERGNSLDITSSFKCPAQMWREGRAPNSVECTDESFVSRALCQ
jgi:hypothetical protein